MKILDLKSYNIYEIAYKIAKKCNSIYCGDIILYIYNKALNDENFEKDENKYTLKLDDNWCFLNYTDVAITIGCTNANVSIAIKKLLKNEILNDTNVEPFNLRAFSLNDKILELL